MTQQHLLFPDVPTPQSRGRKSLVIEAGAGTGKTTRIVREILEVLLDNPELRPERIALVTFTEKAAAEISDRIRFALTDLHASFATERPAWPSDAPEPVLVVPREKREAWASACEAHLRNIDRFRSQTIHSFCQMLLRAHPMAAGLNPQFAIVSGAEATRLLDRAWREWLEQETRRDGGPVVLEQWRIALQHFERLDSVRDVIVSMHSKRDLVSDDSYELGDITEADGELRLALSAIRAHDPSKVAAIDDPHALELVRYLRSAEPPAVADLDAWCEFFSPVSDALDVVTKTRTKSFKEVMRPFLDIDEKKIHDILDGHRAAVAMRAMGKRFIAHVEEVKRREGVVDFEDLLLRTAQLLEIPEVLADLRGRFDFIFVDEFQDTDRVQARIINALSRDAAGRLVEGRTMIVGDPKQGIYSFRRADPETYDATVRDFVAGGARLDRLGRQFRSDPALLRGLNAMFGALFSTPGTPSVARPVYGDDLEPGRDDVDPERPRITFLREAPPAKPRDTEESAHVREARVIASWIGRTATDGDYRRFAILLRRMMKVEHYLEALDRRGIPYLLPPARPLLERRVAVDAIAVLRAIAAPFERSAFISAARSPYFALTDDEIVLDPLAGDDASAMGAFRREIDRYAGLARHAAVRDLLDVVVAEREIDSLYAALQNGDALLSDLERLKQVALDYDLRVGGSLGEFVSEIMRRRDEYEEVERPAIDEAKNSVRIMTVHGAKGLEFDTVIIPDLAAQTGSSPVRVFAVEEPKTLLFTGRIVPIAAMWRFADGQRLLRVPAEREKAEVDRLFYVAVTRAKRDVVFVCDQFTRRGFMPSLQRTFGIEPKELATKWREGVANEVVELPTTEGRVVRARFEQMTVEESEAAPRVRFSNDAWKTIAEALEPGTIEAADPARLTVLERRDAITRRAAAANRKSGTLLHRVLEVWNGDAPALAPLLEKLAIEQGVSEEQASRTKSRVQRLASSAAFRRIAAAETVGREVPIHYADADGAPADGRIDRIIRENGRTAIVDYKSGRSDSKRREHDVAQVRAYCEAWSRMSGEPCGGMLWYVEDDVVVEV